MWTDPNYPQPEPATQPAPSGRIIAASERPGRGRGPDTELRTTLDEYQGNPYISLRVWSRGPDGSWYPTRKGVSVRLGEVDDVAAALIEGARMAHATPARLASRPIQQHTPARPRAEAPARPIRQAATAPPIEEFDAEFDEF